MMPVIAISVSKKVYDYYHSLRSGERSKRFRNILERHLRLEDTYGQERNNYNDLKLENQTLRDNILKLQEVITELHQTKVDSRHWLVRLFLKDTPKEKQQDNAE
ncbi:MAG: hypothetical protein [Circular genetic element sp.]|nr:MAG: hypothetical protein [Circular genetic element sp.]